ncbi:MAG: GNAT family N-acetyltransferase [Neomegalonema sp.]|nr:GNAT family N-acetyltransferase [Neomegalonema sp.]
MDRQTRIAETADLPAIRGILKDAFSQLVERLGFEPTPMHRDYAGLVEQNFVILAEDGAEVIGVAATIPREQHLYIDCLAVTPDRQRAGAGRHLLGAVETLASGLNYAHVRLHTAPRLDAPMSLYRSSGYCLSAYSGCGHTERVMFQKRIASALEISLAGMKISK